MGIKNKIWLSFFTIFLLMIIYLSWFWWVIWTTISLSIYWLIAYIIVLFWKKIRKKPMLWWKDFSIKFMSSIGFSTLIICIIIGWFTYYTNEISPAKMPTYYLTNGEKQLIFQSMSHIGTKNFYDSVIENIREAKQEGYVLYYEWVRPWTVENIEKFNTAIGIEFDEDLYKNFSKLYWVVNQNNDDLLWIENNEDFNLPDKFTSKLVFRDFEIDFSVDQMSRKDAFARDSFIRNNVLNRLDFRLILVFVFVLSLAFIYVIIWRVLPGCRRLMRIA